MQKKVLIITPFYPPNIGGAETFAEALAEEACKEADVAVLTFQSFKGEGAEISYKNGVAIKRLHWPFKPPEVWKGTTLRNFLLVFPKILKATYLELKSAERYFDNGYDVVHAQGLICGLVAILMKPFFKVKVLMTTLALYNFKERGFGRELLARVVRYIVKRCDKVFVEGESGFVDIASCLPSTKHGKIQKFQHWCDLDRFKPNPNPHKTTNVLFVGRPIPEKGYFFYEEIMQHTKTTVSWKAIHGEPYDKLIEYYQWADILVIPSQYEEGIPRVAIEAAACGCLVLGTNRGALPGLIEGNIGCCMDTPEKFAKVIDSMQDKDDLTKFQRKSRAYAEKHFSKENAKVMIDEYN